MCKYLTRQGKRRRLKARFNVQDKWAGLAAKLGLGCGMLHMLHVHACFYARAIASFGLLTLFFLHYRSCRPDSLPLSACSGLFTAARKSPRQQTDRSSGVCACKSFTGLTNCSRRRRRWFGEGAGINGGTGDGL